MISATFPFRSYPAIGRQGIAQSRGACPAQSAPAPRIRRSCPDSIQSTPSSPSPSWRSGCSRAGASSDVFARSLANREGAEVWSFYEGPPTANGRPGSHHVLSRVFKDVYPRYKTMCGYRVPRKAGWDCHGLPVELEVEKQLGIASKQEIEEFGIAEFNQRCRESVFEYVEEWNRLTERIGFWIDLDDPYVTLEDDYIESVWWSLRKLWDDGRLYEGHKVVPYCPRDGTPLSSHEVAQGYKDVEDPSIYVRFPLLDGAGAESGESLLVWTTTPWTLPGNVAVAVAPEVTYVRAQRRRRDPDPRRAAGREGAGGGGRGRRELLRRRPDRPPLQGPGLRARRRRARAEGAAKPFQVVAGDFVTTEDGTGLVHIAPAFGEDDYAVAAANGIFDPTRAREPSTTRSAPTAHFDDRVVGFEDRFVKDPEVTRELIADLERRGLLFREQVYEHSYPHCWRCGTPLLYYATSSWYIAHLRGQGPDARQQRDDRLAPRARQARPLRQMAGEQRRLGALAATATGARRCRSGAAPTASCGELFCVGSVAELRERSKARGPRRPPPPLHRRGRRRLRAAAAARCGASTR